MKPRTSPEVSDSVGHIGERVLMEGVVKGGEEARFTEEHVVGCVMCERKCDVSSDAHLVSHAATHALLVY